MLDLGVNLEFYMHFRYSGSIQVNAIMSLLK